MFSPPWSLCTSPSTCADGPSWASLRLPISFPLERPPLISPKRSTLFSSSHPCVSCHDIDTMYNSLIILLTYPVSLPNPGMTQGSPASSLIPILSRCSTNICQMNELALKMTLGLIVDKPLPGVFLISGRWEVNGSSHRGLSNYWP